VQLFQALDDEKNAPECIFKTSEPGENEPPPGPEDVKTFDILEFVKSQEDEAEKFVGETDEEKTNGR
jgi:hypothetical protein